MNFQLFLFNCYDGDVNKSIQYHAYELFGVSPDDWKTLLREELYLNFQRGLPSGYQESEMIADLFKRFQAPIDHFIYMLKHEFIEEVMDIHVLKVENTSHYRIVGIDLVFKIMSTKLLVLQVMGND